MQTRTLDVVMGHCPLQIDKVLFSIGSILLTGYGNNSREGSKEGHETIGIDG